MTDGDREILEHFTRTRNKTMDLLRLTPDEWLGRTAEGEDHTLGWVFSHIALGVDHWMHRCMKDESGTPEVDDQDKSALLAALEASRDRLVNFFAAHDGRPLGSSYSMVRRQTGVEESFIGRNRVLYLTQHEAHHRGKVVLALRQWGFTDIPFLPY